MIIYNNNIIRTGANWNKEQADSWCHEDCYATGGIVSVFERRLVREGNWVVGNSITLSSVPATGGIYRYNLGVTAPFHVSTSSSWLDESVGIYINNVHLGSAVTASDLLEIGTLEETGGIVGTHYEVLKYFPISIRISVPRNITVRQRSGGVNFNNDGGNMRIYHPATGTQYTVFNIFVIQQGI